MSSPPSKPFNPDDYFPYNPSWCDQIFTGRATAEALLAPQHADGHLTTHDYNLSVEHFSHSYGRYPLIGGAFGASISMAYKPRKVPRIMLVLGAFASGYLIGQARSVTKHMAYVRSLENPAGVKIAMENIEKQVGGPRRRGVVIAVPLKSHDSDVEPIVDTFTPTTANGPPSEEKPSPDRFGKWDEIRRVNSQKGSNSTWDAIRQQNEKAALHGQPSQSQTQSDAWNRDISEVADTSKYRSPDPRSPSRNE